MNELLNQIEKIEWYKQAANSKAYYIFIPCRAAADNLGAKSSIWSIKNMKFMEWVSPMADFIKTSQYAIDNQKKDPSFANDYLKKCDKRSSKLNEFYEKYLNVDFSKLCVEEISNALQELEKINYEYWIFSYLCDAFDPKGDEMLQNEINNNNINLTKNEINIFMRTNWKNYMQKERLAMLKLALKVKNNQLSIDDAKSLLEKHAKEFFYIDNSWESTTVLTTDYFMKRLNETLNLNVDEINEQFNDLKTDWEEKHKQLQKKYSIPEELMNTFCLFRNLFRIRDQRKYHTLINNHIYDSFFKQISEIFSLNFKDMNVILAEEITPDINADKLKQKIKERKEIILEKYSEKLSELYSGEDGLTINKAVNCTFSHVGNEIKGNTAFEGKVKGIVRVIVGEAHFSKFSSGEILVTSMTRPEFLPLMKKAKAIITDEGGVTCHAAIVSRELQIPCIVGTKIATKVLKDNDLIEVDAEKGIVRKI
jgi:phosphohistidine swiveling domain-containing protein